MSYYLKYRPQKLADLGLGEVREKLIKILSSPEIPHAFLFAGPRGIGKTSAARIIAKAVNCEKSASQRVSESASQQKKEKQKAVKLSNCPAVQLKIEPCNSCDSCLAITTGTNLDILEIDGASNRGIDDIRDLKEKIKLAPIKSLRKVYIIDEVHMLTNPAFNALLKTLEEPPAHAIFILCTTEPQKLPTTIISRCLRFNFRKAKIEELVGGLEKIVKSEKLKVEDGVLAKIAQAGDGSFRDSQKILQQVATGEKKITKKALRETLGQLQGMEPEKLLEFLAKKDVKAGILEIGRIMKNGANLRWFVEQLLEQLRLGLLAKLGISDEGSSSTETLKFAEALKIEEIKDLIEIFNKSALELKTAIVPQLPLEMGVIEWCGREKAEKVKQVAQVEKVEQKKQVVQVEKVGQVEKSALLSFQEVEDKWPEILEALKPKNHSIQAFLRATRLKQLDEGTLVLEVFYQFHKAQLESDRCRRLIEETIEAVLKTPVKLRCVLGSRPEKYTMPLPNELPITDDGSSVGDSDIMKVAEEIFGKPVD